MESWLFMRWVLVFQTLAFKTASPLFIVSLADSVLRFINDLRAKKQTPPFCSPAFLRFGIRHLARSLLWNQVRSPPILGFKIQRPIFGISEFKPKEIGHLKQNYVEKN